MEQKFNHRHNKMYKTEDGNFYHSRSCAVVAHTICIVNNTPYYLIGKRGPNMDKPFLYNVPCGYMDWDETGIGAVKRELFEETGIYLDDYVHKIYNNNQPWYVHTDPNENRQNIVLHYGIIIYTDSLPKLHLDNMEEGESLGAFWWTYREINNSKPEIFAFNHLDYINKYIKLLQK